MQDLPSPIRVAAVTQDLPVLLGVAIVERHLLLNRLAAPAMVPVAAMAAAVEVEPLQTSLQARRAMRHLPLPLVVAPGANRRLEERAPPQPLASELATCKDGSEKEVGRKAVRARSFKCVFEDNYDSPKVE